MISEKLIKQQILLHINNIKDNMLTIKSQIKIQEKYFSSTFPIIDSSIVEIFDSVIQLENYINDDTIFQTQKTGADCINIQCEEIDIISVRDARRECKNE